MAVDISKKTWFADLIRRILETYDPAAARLRLPAEVRDHHSEGPDLEGRARMLVVRSLRRRPALPGIIDATSAFLAPIEEHIALALDLALLQGCGFEAPRRRAELAALFAAAAGKLGVALAADPGRPAGATPTAVRKALVRAGRFFRRRCYPPGDPELGLPLYSGALAIDRRHLARLAMAYFARGKLERATLEEELERTRGELSFFVEALTGLATVKSPLDPERRRVVKRQLSRLGFSPSQRRRALSPRAARDLAGATPARLRPFILEQLLVAELARAPGDAPGLELIRTWAEAAQVSPDQLTSMQVEAAAFHADYQRWLEAFGASLPQEWQALGQDWEAMSDRLLERVAGAVTDNLEAIIREVKQTGELGQLLAKAAAGKKLTAKEKQKVKGQLIDLAKAVPALAIFAAPGGMLLLPLLVKILPFDVLPSAWNEKEPRVKEPRGPGTPPAKGTPT